MFNLFRILEGDRTVVGRSNLSLDMRPLVLFILSVPRREVSGMLKGRRKGMKSNYLKLFTCFLGHYKDARVVAHLFVLVVLEHMYGLHVNVVLPSILVGQFQSLHG